MKEPDLPLYQDEAMPENRTPFQRYGFALLAVAVAFGIRLGFDEWLDPNPGPNSPPKHAFILFILATIFATWYGGLGPSIVAALTGAAFAAWFFLPPRHSFLIANFLDFGLPPLLLQMTVIVFGSSMHKARRRADASARDAISHQKRLEQEVAERKRAEEEVHVLNLELERRVASRTEELVMANQDLESFTYSVSHDLRAPLRHVDGFAQFLEEEYGSKIPEEAQALVKKIRRGSQNMGRLVDDLLNLSRIGKKELARQHTELTPLLDSALADVKLDNANRKIEWHTEPLPAVDCDAGLVKQVFVNLLSNSAKYTRPRDNARIDIGQKAVDGATAIFIRDNGVGFNMKYAGKLFGVFQRLHRSEEFEGTGVGLATVARIIRKHGGNIWAESEVDNGATFYFTLGPGNSKVDAAANGQIR
jgi:signal transduction histidine kinase